MNSDTLKKSFVIGVCGHKDITTPENLIRGALASFWKQIRTDMPDTAFLLLDSLAEGGDQMVLESKPEDVPFDAVLPFAKTEYEKDFESAGAKRIFNNFLASAESVVTAGAEPGDYTKAADYLLANADMILTLWDCVITEGTPAPGGSYDTVVKAMAKGIPVIVIPAHRKKTYKNALRDIFPADCAPFELTRDFTLTPYCK